MRWNDWRRERTLYRRRVGTLYRRKVGTLYWRSARTLAGILGAAVLLLLFFLAASSLWLLSGKFLLKNPHPSVLGYMPVYVLSGSMEPAFSAGDLLLVRQGGSYEPGDIVTFESEGELVTHRIVRQSPDGFTTQGDANNTADDGTITEAQIIGKVCVAVPFLGRAALFIRTIQGKLCLAALFLLALDLSFRKTNRKG